MAKPRSSSPFGRNLWPKPPKSLVHMDSRTQRRRQRGQQERHLLHEELELLTADYEELTEWTEPGEAV